MTDRQTILDTYARLEADTGGIAAPGGDAKTVAVQVAAELGVTYEEVRDVLLSEWTGMGAG